MLHIGKLLKQGFTVSKLKSSLYLSHKWPQQCSVCLSEAFKFARLVPPCDIRDDIRFGSSCISVICMYVRILVSNKMSCLAESANPIRSPDFKWGSCCYIISFLYTVLWIVVCPFVIFRFTFVLSVFWSTATNYTCGIFKLFSIEHVMVSVQENKQRFNMNILCYNTIYGLCDITM